MKETIDHYAYWNKKRKENNLKKDLFDREKKSLKYIAHYAPPNAVILDAGCGNGEYMGAITRALPEAKTVGIDFSHEEVREAQKKGLSVKRANLEKKIPFPKANFDMVYAGEVIEHLYDPDSFVTEVNRVLKEEGYFIFSTPNLCAWFNRILFPLGIQPLFLEMSTKSKLIGAGVLRGLKKEAEPVGHIRIFTYRALKDLLEENGFEVKDARGALYDSALPKALFPIDRLFSLFPKLASDFVIIAQKRKMRS